MKILISDNFSARGVEVLNRFEQFQVDQNVGLKPDELKAIIGQYQALIVRSETRVTADIIAAADNEGMGWIKLFDKVVLINQALTTKIFALSKDFQEKLILQLVKAILFLTINQQWI